MRASLRARLAPLPEAGANENFMNLDQFLLPDAVLTHIRAGTKKQLLSEMAAAVGPSVGLEPLPICQALSERERLGSTGIGEGVALPHAKVEGLERLTVAFARLQEPVDFDSADDEPVDLIAALLMPEDESQQSEHLKVLSKISRRLKDPDLRNKIRGAQTQTAIFALLTGEPDQHAAA